MSQAQRYAHCGDWRPLFWWYRLCFAR